MSTPRLTTTSTSDSARLVPVEAAPSVPLLTGGWLSTEELAGRLGVDTSTLRRWRTARPMQGPPFVRLSDRVTLYSVVDVERWLADRRIAPEVAA